MIKHLQSCLKYSSVQLLLPAVLQLLLTQAALGQEDIIPDVCKRFVSPVSRLTYENELHRRWYVSWWDGKCDGLGSWPFCQSKPYWETIAEPVLEQNPNADRMSLIKELCTLGQLIGHEFARDNDWRCIDRNDLRAWADKIRSSEGNIFQKIAEVRSEAEVKLRLAGPGKSCTSH